MDINSYQNTPLTGQKLLLRSIALFTNFLLIIVAYYQVKAASRSLLLEYGGPDSFPYVWIGSALVLLVFIYIYQWLIKSLSRNLVVIGSLTTIMFLLVFFWFAFAMKTIFVAISFYIFVDIFSVILVEQFWSLTNAVSRTEEGHKTYWFVSSGGLVGGIAGGAVASSLVRFTPMQTEDLLLSCAITLVVTIILTVFTSKSGLYNEVPEAETIKLSGEGFKTLINNHFLLLIAAIICLSQLVQPIVEYQFLSMVNDQISLKDKRTEFISDFFVILGFTSLAINFSITPLVHRYLGAMAGLFVQPLILSITALTFIYNTTLTMASVMKVSDRGLSYSINRASKELLYVPINPIHIYQVKAWIDMLGYRLFKVIGASLILILGRYLAERNMTGLSMCTVLICLLWILVITRLTKAYKELG